MPKEKREKVLVQISSPVSESSSPPGEEVYIDRPRIDPDHLRGVTRQSLKQALESEITDNLRRLKQCKKGSPVAQLQLPLTRHICVEQGVIFDPPAPPLLYGVAIVDSAQADQRSGPNRPWDNQPLPPHIRPPAWKLSQAPDWTPAMMHTDLAAINRDDAAPPRDQLVLAQQFQVPLGELFERLFFAADWRLNKLDVARDYKHRLTYEQAVKKIWCTSATPEALKKRFARFDYHESYLTYETFRRLQEKESHQPGGSIEYQREQARIRQARHRKDIPETERDQIKQRDRAKYRKKYFRPHVTEITRRNSGNSLGKNPMSPTVKA